MRILLFAMAAGLIACATNEGTGPAAPTNPEPPATPSGVGAPCYVSLVQNVDGKPAAQQLCEKGLTCDYANAVPDGPGRCKQP